MLTVAVAIRHADSGWTPWIFIVLSVSEKRESRSKTGADVDSTWKLKRRCILLDACIFYCHIVSHLSQLINPNYLKQNYSENRPWESGNCRVVQRRHSPASAERFKWQTPSVHYSRNPHVFTYCRDALRKLKEKGDIQRLSVSNSPVRAQRTRHQKQQPSA